ncbi:hypothetical protein LDO26_01185 [Luteimonas sp. BDR2-5]|uniref:hypothetical protein n=1 Tax=Proluteimonas luteida TaxID=2878685 RepID=UPI001E483B3C|nr:hypothetical protein [Luteimonas sp. BDR2-5]MCD9026830.1 hypothetical protein [Luteimonas sp. BDR2-5]
MIRALALLTLAALTACASSTPIRWAPATDYTLDIVDNPDRQRFDVTSTSKATAPLCLSKEAWPALEALPAGFDGATLSTSAGTQALLPTGSAYCPGGCGDVRVEPGQTLVGVIPYAAFGNATIIAADTSRTLVFEVHPFICAR